MKKLIIAMCCVAIAGGANAQNAKTTAAPQAQEKLVNKNGPKFQFKGGETFDFGKIAEGPVAEHVFEFKNVGKEPLIIQNASASCGCTTPEWPKEPILPGKTGKITVHFTTAGRGNQPFDKTVFISSNAATDKERYELHIKGFVNPAEPKAGDAAKKATN
jgi:hypothetical protein